MNWTRTMAVAGLLVWSANTARGYMVGPPLPLEKLIAESDIIFKGTVISSDPVQDDWFKPYPSFEARETKFKVISILKGNGPGVFVRFRHYAEAPTGVGMMFHPQYYRFQSNLTYVVFAKDSEQPGVFRQLWMYHTGKQDEGVVQCSDEKTVVASTVKDALWSELLGMLDSGSVSNVLYGMAQLDQMSGGREYDSTRDFDGTNVVAVVHKLMCDSDAGVADAAIDVIGTHNPYMSENNAPFWLTTVGSADLAGYGKWDPKPKNVGGELYRGELAAIANGKGSAEIRARAIRALGLVREPSLRTAIGHWLVDAAPAVRASAALLQADFPGPDSIRNLTALVNDPAPQVRACAAYAIGYGQVLQSVDLLERLLSDQDPPVRKAAAMSLLSFSVKEETVARVFQRNENNREWKPLFLNVLAKENPQPYLEGLAVAVEEKTEPSNWWGGQIPAFHAWEILFKYLQKQPADVVRSGKLDRYLDAMEKVGNYSSSEPRDIYAFYLQRDMKDRAEKFRESAKKAVSYDLDYYFKQVDQNPAAYQRE